MEYKETYEKFWERNKNLKFEDYERNNVLHEFFPEQREVLTLADIGGGAGIVARWLQRRGYDVTLLDISEQALASARERGIVKLVQEDEQSNNIPLPNNAFDYVFFGDVIEHLFDPEQKIKEINRILKLDGRLVLSCPNIAYWRFRTYYMIDGDLGRIDVARQKPWEQEHIRFYNIRILKEFLEKNGFEFMRYRGVNNIWHSRLLVKWLPNLFAHTIVAEFKKTKKT